MGRPIFSRRFSARPAATRAPQWAFLRFPAMWPWKSKRYSKSRDQRESKIGRNRARNRRNGLGRAGEPASPGFAVSVYAPRLYRRARGLTLGHRENRLAAGASDG